MPELATELHSALRRAGIPSFHDDSGSIGRRYRRQDEAGTPFCITIDGQTVSDRTVTVRHRDTLVQERISADHVAGYVQERMR
jgi:glycyl-tRNA synthetase